VVKNQHEDKISIVEMKMFVEVALMIDKIVKTRFWWSEHVEKIYEHFIVKKIDRINHSQITRGINSFFFKKKL